MYWVANLFHKYIFHLDLEGNLNVQIGPMFCQTSSKQKIKKSTFFVLFQSRRRQMLIEQVLVKGGEALRELSVCLQFLPIPIHPTERAFQKIIKCLIESPEKGSIFCQSINREKQTNKIDSFGEKENIRCSQQEQYTGFSEGSLYLQLMPAQHSKEGIGPNILIKNEGK